MKRSIRRRTAGFVRFGACGLAALFAGPTACGGPPDDQPEPLQGAELVAGTSLARRGLLVVSKTGAPAEFRSTTDPSSIRWTGRLTLPAASAVYSLGPVVVIRHEEGASLYTPAPESLDPLPEVPAHARWIESSTGGAFVANGWAMTVTSTGSRVVTAEGEILWAAPAASGRAVGLVDVAGSPQLVVWDVDVETPAKTLSVGTRGPMVLAAWGREIVGTTADGRQLLGWSLPDLEPTEALEIDGAPRLLVTSPSQHRVFAATERPRLVAVDRYDWRTVGTTRLDEPLKDLRAAVSGEQIVVFDGAAAWTVRAGETGRAQIPGEWRSDLPMPLPGGDVLAVSSAGLRRFASDGSDLGPVEGPVDAWWVPLRWGPRAPVIAVATAPGDSTEEDPPRSTGRGIGLLTMGTASDRSVGATRRRLPQDAPDGASSAGLAAAPRVPGGFYAVANSSRRLESLGQLRQSLDGSGYSTHVLPRVDEANETWYRLLVGPYRSRAAADAVVRELRRERGIDAWIHEADGNEGGQ